MANDAGDAMLGRIGQEDEEHTFDGSSAILAEFYLV